MNGQKSSYDIYIYIYQAENEHSDILRFINEVDHLFPIPLSEKCDLPLYCEKILNNGIFIVASHQGQIVGLLGGYANDLATKSAYISLVAVLPEFQNQSIAQRLIHTFFDICEKRNMKKVFLHTHSKNYAAQHMYEKLGFERAESERPDDILYEYFFGR